MPRLHESNGFTFLEALFSLTIITIILFLSTPILTSIRNPSYYEEQASLHLFHFIQEEINASKSFSLNGNTLQIVSWDDRIIQIEQYGTIVRRTVNGTGHETLLTPVESFTIHDNGPSTLTLEVQIHEDSRFQRLIHLP